MRTAPIVSLCSSQAAVSGDAFSAVICFQAYPKGYPTGIYIYIYAPRRNREATVPVSSGVVASGLCSMYSLSYGYNILSITLRVYCTNSVALYYCWPEQVLRVLAGKLSLASVRLHGSHVIFGDVIRVMPGQGLQRS